MRREYDFNILPHYKHPNLVAEFMESGYSLCTLSEHMGRGRCEEDDIVINRKIFGDEEILAEEALGLMKLFGCKFEYLFSDKLEMFGEVPIAYIRYYESNKRQKQELELLKISEEVRKTLKSKPYLGEFMKVAMTWSEKQVRQATEMLQKLETT